MPPQGKSLRVFPPRARTAPPVPAWGKHPVYTPPPPAFCSPVLTDHIAPTPSAGAAPFWPSFWSSVPDEDRPAIRDALADLLGRGVVNGSEGSGREVFLLIRDHYQPHISDYLSPLGIDLIIDDEASLLQARPRSETCQLMATFSRDETLVLLALWRVWDDDQSTRTGGVVIITVDDLWNKLRLFFDRIDPPEKSQIDGILAKLRRHRLVRTHRPDGMTHAGEMQLEILPSLSRVIPFDDLEAWMQRADLCQPAPDATTEPLLPMNPALTET